MNLRLTIRRNSDGALATDLWPNWEFNIWWWQEGNAGCDCNRQIFFLRAHAEDDEIETECGEGRYSVRLEDADTGVVLLDELQLKEPL